MEHATTPYRLMYMHHYYQNIGVPRPINWAIINVQKNIVVTTLKLTHEIDIGEYITAKKDK